MNPVDEHSRWRGVMDSATADTLSPAEINGMLAHADQCPGCAPALRDFAARALVAQAPVAAMDPPRSADLRARILATASHRPAVASRKRRRGSAFAGTGGWMAAAALAVALLTHHAFHEPLRAGWMAAAVLALLAFGLGVYANLQRRRAAEMKRQLCSTAGPGEARRD